MTAPPVQAEQATADAKAADLSPDERSKARVARLLIYACQGATAAISVAIAILYDRGVGPGGPPPEMWIAWGVNALLGTLGGAAAVIFFWPVSRERWLRAGACLVFGPVMHLGAVVALTTVAACFGLIR